AGGAPEPGGSPQLGGALGAVHNPGWSGQSSTTWLANRPRAAAHAAWSKVPSGARASAAAQAMARAWWVLSWTNRPRRPKLSRAGWAAAQASRAWNGVA